MLEIIFDQRVGKVITYLVATGLFLGLMFGRPNSSFAKVMVGLSGAFIGFVIIGLILITDISRENVMHASMISIVLCMGLLDWNAKRLGRKGWFR